MTHGWEFKKCQVEADENKYQRVIAINEEDINVCERVWEEQQ